jgi:hypothetical protein
MKIHSSTGKTFSVCRIAFLVLVSIALNVKVQQNSAQVEDRVNGILSLKPHYMP